MLEDVFHWHPRSGTMPKRGDTALRTSLRPGGSEHWQVGKDKKGAQKKIEKRYHANCSGDENTLPKTQPCSRGNMFDTTPGVN